MMLRAARHVDMPMLLFSYAIIAATRLMPPMMPPLNMRFFHFMLLFCRHGAARPCLLMPLC